jgi:hypothetical protein
MRAATAGERDERAAPPTPNSARTPQPNDQGGADPYNRTGRFFVGTR